MISVKLMIYSQSGKRGVRYNIKFIKRNYTLETVFNACSMCTKKMKFLFSNSMLQGINISQKKT